MRPRPKRRAGRPVGLHRVARRGTGVTAPPDRLEPPTWHAWKAQNGSKRWYWRYPLAIEWAFEQANHGLHQWAFVEFLEYAGRFTILVVAIFWFLEAGDRAKERHYRAWDLINSARGSTGDGGRKDALQDLNKDGVSLAAAPLEKASLPKVDLRGAYLVGTRLEGANLAAANLEGARLGGANLHYADLGGARNLTQDQLDATNGDDRTQLPWGLTRPAHWSRSKGNEGQSGDSTTGQ
jgi:hypothetical protein